MFHSPSDSTGPTNSTDRARQAYLASLIDVAVSNLVHAASLGWTPADLRHEFGGDIEHLLHQALPQIVDALSPPISDIWVREAVPSLPRSLGTEALEEMNRRLTRLPSLDDISILEHGDPVDIETRFLDSLSPDQRKAHHRIQALLRKAESTTFEAEADALVSKAEQLRQQHRIESVILRSYGAQPTTHAQITSVRIRLRAPWVNHQLRLLGKVASAHSCTALLVTCSGITTVIGQPDDLRHVTDLFSSLNRQRDHLMRTSPGAHQAARDGETSSYRRSFMIAYADRIGHLLRAAAKDVLSNLGEAAPEAEKSILPVLASRATASQRMLAELFPSTRHISFSARHPRGYRDGRSAADRSHFSGDSSGVTGHRQVNRRHHAA